VNICEAVQYAAIQAAPEDIREDFSRCLNLRNAILDIVYSIDGYEDMPASRQREVYDAIRAELLGA
jgi:hypothetical protein